MKKIRIVKSKVSSKHHLFPSKLGVAKSGQIEVRGEPGLMQALYMDVSSNQGSLIKLALKMEGLHTSSKKAKLIFIPNRTPNGRDQVACTLILLPSL